MPKPELRGISSMATRQVLQDLASAYEQRVDCAVRIESVGGVDAARRVAAGEEFDLVILAADAVAKLEAGGHVVAGSTVPLVRSPVAIAVPAAAPRPDVASEEALKQAVRAAATIGYSTGPSGTALLQLFERWGLAQECQPKLVQAPAGVPVGSLVAEGKVALGFQQKSELIHQLGIALVGEMPPGTEIVTTFSGAVCTASRQPQAVRALLAFMASPEATEPKQRQGMQPAT